MNLLQHITNGLVLGHAYALVAIGWTLLLGVARMVNFGHGQFYMLGAFTTWLGIHALHLPYAVAIPFAMVIGATVGALMQRVMLRLTLEQNLTSMMMVTLGFGLLIEGASGLLFGSGPRFVKTPLNDIDIHLANVWLTGRDLAVVLVTLVAFAALHWTLQRTRVGAWVRMVAEDPQLAKLGGLNVARVYLGVFAFEGAAVALAAAVASPNLPILPSMGFDELIFTFVVVVLGGVGSVVGSYVAGVGLGLFSALFGAFVSPAYTTAAAFLVLVVILVLRPADITRTAKGSH